jgi:hypothetical protein
MNAVADAVGMSPLTCVCVAGMKLLPSSTILVVPVVVVAVAVAVGDALNPPPPVK